MATYLYIATALGVFIAAQTNGNWDIVRHTLKDKSLTSITAAGGIIIAGSAEGIWRSSNNGKSWNEANENLAVKHVRWLAHTGHDRTIFMAGTEPAGIFVSRNGGQSWIGSPDVSKLRDANHWFLPYSPEAGCVRGFAAAQSADRRGRIYAAAEVGGVLISDDRGNTWRMVAGSDGKPHMNRDLGTMIHPDVHSITVHPSSPDLVTAATGGGLYRSTDGGRNWRNIYPSYIRAIWVDPADHRHIIAGPADGVSRNGRIEESFDGGHNWHPASEGMMPAPWSSRMVERFFQLGNDLFGVLSSGELWVKPAGQTQWRRVLSKLPPVKAVTGATR